MEKRKKRWGKKRTFLRDWKMYNEELVRRGTFYLDFSWVQNWKNEVAEMNQKKVGRPYVFPNSLIELQAVWLEFTDYRGVEGITRKVYEIGQIPNFNDYSTISRRIKQLNLKFDIPRGKEVFVSTDGTGIKMNMSGEYFEAKYGSGKKKFIKVILSADPFSKEMLKLDVSLEGEELSEPDVAMTHITELEAEEHRILGFWGDGSFDTHDLFDHLDYYNIPSSVKIRKNAIIDPGGSVRRNIEVKKYQEEGYNEWSKKRKYGQRWVGTEGIFSAVKRKFGERVRAKLEINMLREAKRRFWVYEKIRKYAQA